MEEFQHDKYTLTALKLVRLGRSFFITGKAGTGKTTLLREIVRECRARGKNIVVAAPTGVAAKNAEGQTLHSLFGLKTIVFIPGKVKRWNRPLDKAKVNVIKNLEILIIDEVSMVRCDVMDMVDLTLQHYKGNKKPFGGIQVILFGDLFQLPPVVGDDEDKELLYSYYEKDNSFFFSSDVIRKNPFPVLELSKVYRQQDQKFVKILNHIREGVYLESDRNEINMRLKIGYEPSEDDSAVYLRTINWKVGRYNYSKLRKLSNELYIFNAIKKGNFPKNLYPTDDPLKLKVGARVMLLRNDNDGLRYVNGTLGFITSINSKYIRVLTDEGEAITVEQALWKLYKYEWDEKKKSIIPVEYASFKQFPLKMAWAVTIHKSQGMTFDKVIVDAHNSFDSGQVYVALSRCRTLDGITLTSKISKNDIKINPKVIEYMESVTRIDPSEIEESDISEQQTFILSKNGKTVKGIISEAYGKIVIPDGVEKIEDNAFKDNTRITDVVCPKSLRVIGDRVFSGCINLRTIQLNEGLVSIGTGAFFHTGLESVYLPSTLELLNFYPFECKMNVLQPSDHFYSDAAGVLYSADRKSLVLFPRKVDKKVIKVPDRITCIKYFAFIECSAMEIVIPEGIKKLEGYLFLGCQNLRTITFLSSSPKKIVIQESVFEYFEVENCVLRVPFDALSEYSSDVRFKDFKYITAIEGSRCLRYDKTGKEITGCDIDGCENIEIPEGVTSIKDEAFEDNLQIESVHFPDSLLTIGSQAFSGCMHITDVNLNEGLVSIDWDAFRGTDLSKVYIPYTVEQIGASAFGCEMEVQNHNLNYISVDGILYSLDEKNLVIYPAKKKQTEFEVPDTVEEISSFAFEDSGLKSLILPYSIKTLGRSFLGSDPKINKLTINVDNPNNLNVDENVFEFFNKSLCRLIVPEGYSANYLSNNCFKGFLTVEEMQEGSQFETISKSGYVTGQYFQNLLEGPIAESKLFCQYKGNYYCYIVMTCECMR